MISCNDCMVFYDCLKTKCFRVFIVNFGHVLIWRYEVVKYLFKVKDMEKATVSIDVLKLRNALKHKC